MRVTLEQDCGQSFVHWGKSQGLTGLSCSARWSDVSLGLEVVLTYMLIRETQL